MKQPINRNEVLKEPFNAFFNHIVQTNGVDYYQRLTTRDYVTLKTVLSNINNIITLQTTQAFVGYLYKCDVIDVNQRKVIIKNIEKTNANANGFDVYYKENIGNAEGIIAEVKCNRPVKSDNFGTAQFNSLKKDIEGLLHGKKKVDGVDISKYYKFMVMLNDDERVPRAAHCFVEKMLRNEYKVEITDTLNLSDLQTDRVYVVLLSLK